MPWGRNYFSFDFCQNGFDFADTSAATLKQRLQTDETWLKIHFKLTFSAYFSFVIFIITWRRKKKHTHAHRKKATSLDPHINLHSSHSTILLIPPEESSKVPDAYAMAICWEIKPIYFLTLFYSSERRGSTGEIDGDEKGCNIHKGWCSDRKVVIEKR